MKFFYTILAITAYCNIKTIYAVNPVPASVEVHFWRDFSGLLPSDAIKAGTDSDGEDTYIGQFSVKATYGEDRAEVHLLPAIIRKGVAGAYAAYNNRVIHSSNTTNVKILCGPKNYYYWDSMDGIYSPGCYLVVTGYEDNSFLYTGRATVGKEVITGKIFAEPGEGHYSGLSVPILNTEEVSRPESYEILSYCK